MGTVVFPLRTLLREVATEIKMLEVIAHAVPTMYSTQFYEFLLLIVSPKKKEGFTIKITPKNEAATQTTFHSFILWPKKTQLITMEKIGAILPSTTAEARLII